MHTAVKIREGSSIYLIVGNDLGAYSKIRSTFISPRSIPMLAVFVLYVCMTKIRVVAGGKVGRMFFWGLLLLEAALVSLGNCNGQGIVRSQ